MTTDTNNPMDQSELREKRVTGVKRGKTRASNSLIDFGFTSDWLIKWCELL